jgi:hypothetical protein
MFVVPAFRTRLAHRITGSKIIAWRADWQIGRRDLRHLPILISLVLLDPANWSNVDKL